MGVLEAFLAWSGRNDLWPHTPRGNVELVAVVLATLAGIASLARTAAELLTRPKPRQRRRSDHELARLTTETRTDSLTRLANRRAFDDGPR